MSSDEVNNDLPLEDTSTAAEAAPRKRATKKAAKKAAKKATKKAAKKAAKKRATKKSAARKVADEAQADMFTPGEIAPPAVKKTVKKTAKASADKSAVDAPVESTAAAATPAPQPKSAPVDDEVTFSSDIKVDQFDEPQGAEPTKKTEPREKREPREGRLPREKRDNRGPKNRQPNGSDSRGGDHSEGGKPQQSGPQSRQSHPNDRNNKGNAKGNNKFNKNNNKRNKRGKGRWDKNKSRRGREEDTPIELGELLDWEVLAKREDILALAEELRSGGGDPLDYVRLYNLPLPELREEVDALGIKFPHAPNRDQLINAVATHAAEKKAEILTTGVLELLEDDEGGLLVYERDSYRIKALSAYVPQAFIEHYGLQRGHIVKAQLQPHREGESCPVVVRVQEVMGRDPETLTEIVPFTERVPYYPTSRILMEADSEAKWDNLSMRVVDCLTPVGFGQRGLIVAPPRTGKTVLMQGMANSIQKNYPDAHLIILLIDERPEEVTDFRRQVSGEVISSTFDEAAESHVHAAEMVIEKARRMVETGEDVIILLDSITRLARAYNTTMPSSGKILSGGVEANALQKPKRFFGSARNIEDGGSLTIIATALVETGSKMDEVIFEEFKGTGNMELHLDRGLSDKRIFPALSMDKSGTRKEELLYHPDEMLKIYSLRRAMKGLPSTDAMEMLIQRIKKTNTNAEFLMSVAR